MVDAEMQKKVAPSRDAAALARSVFPVPGGPNRRMPFGISRRRDPRRRCAPWMGYTAAW
jgi:hypothetical protein